MRSDLRRICLTTLAAAALSASAFAGFRGMQQVVIVDERKLANADIGYVHSLEDDVQYIGCFVAGDAGYCFARALDGRTRSCWSDNPTWLKVMSGVSSDTYLIFYWDDGGYCTYINAQNGSIGPAK